MTESYAAYCVIDSACELIEGVAGLHGCRVRNLAYREIGVAASPLSQPIDDVVAKALEHETVVERLMRTHTVLPMRFPAVFASREAVLAMAAQHYDDFQENLRRLRGQVEFGIRVLWPRAILKARQEESLATSGSRCRTSQGATPTGRLYMLERYRQHKDRQALSEQAARFGLGLDAALEEFATAKRIRSFTPDSFAFTGVYLVSRDKEADFRRAFLKAKSAEPDFRYLFSGPWPPYNFITVRPERQTAAPANRTVATDLVECLGLGAVGGTHDRGTES